MYGAEIQTTLSIQGHVVFIKYRVTEEWAVEWWVNIEAYQPEEYWIMEDDTYALDLLDTLLRTYQSERIEEKLLSEFEERQYAYEQSMAARLEQEDVPF